MPKSASKNKPKTGVGKWQKAQEDIGIKHFGAKSLKKKKKK